ncbi:MAG: alcohol dehydrogenase catalytic domain-containing protein [Synergistaceae bacterium]|nr:alcohol dehydrogenase catalytic domain-containing protein [Synergistaceae bacterium]
MRAIVYEGPYKISVKEIPMPEVREGWALVKVSHAGICGTDLNIYAGTHPRAKAPLVMSHEFSGTLESDDVNGIAKGEKVTVYPLLSCGGCEPCRSGNAHVCNSLKLLGIDVDGAFAEYVQVPEKSVIRLPANVSGLAGALVEPVAVAVHTLREKGYKPGDNALIFGCGPIGMSIAITLSVFGSESVLMMETDKARAELAREMGFEVFDLSGLSVESFCKERTGGNGFDWVFDCAGVQPVADVLFDAVKVKGKIVVVAGYKKPAAVPLIKGMFKEADMLFVRVYRLGDFAIAAQIVARTPLYEKMITHVLPVSEAQKGFDLLTTQGTGAVKVMFDFNGGTTS